MERSREVWRRIAVLVLALVAAAFLWVSPAAASFDCAIHGQILDLEGKPWANLTVVAESSQGRKIEAKTNKNGEYSITALSGDTYTIKVFLPGQEQPYEATATLKSGDDLPINFNFKEIATQQGHGEAVKKQAQEKEKFESLKGHFTAGNGFMDQAKQVQSQLATAPADQLDTLKLKLAGLSAQAAGEFEAARNAAGEKDPNLHTLWARLGDAYQIGGRNEDAIKAYEQAIALKPEVARYYNDMGNILARQGKIEEASKAYVKSAQVDPPNAAMAWRNFGIVLYNAGRLKEAVEPFRKATALEPKHAQTWYLLGSAMVGSIEFKQEGGKLVPNVLPGTVEAYQKAVELDPNGPIGAQAKQALAELEVMAPGIQTSFGATKKPKKP